MYILNGQILGKCNAPRFKTRFPGSLSGETFSGASVNALASAKRTQNNCVKLSGADLNKRAMALQTRKPWKCSHVLNLTSH